MVRGPHADTGKFHLQTRYDPRTGTKSAGRVAITSLHDDYPGMPSFLGMVPLQSWSTKTAAEAAIPHFRAWIDGGRRKQTAAANQARQPPEVDPTARPERCVLWHQQQRSSTSQLAAATAAARSAWAATAMVAAVVVPAVILTAVARPEDKGIEC